MSSDITDGIADTKRMKLNLGCGDHRMEGFVGVDVVPGDAVDQVANVLQLPYGDNSIEEIAAFQVIEHLFPHETQGLFHEWFRVLQPGGALYVTTPDFGYVAEQYVAGQMSVNLARAYITGTVEGLNSFDPEVPASYHRTMWDRVALGYELATAGFQDISDWNETWNLHCRARKG